MSIYYSSVLLAIFMNVSYHLCMKFTHADVPPMASLAVTYAVALVLCLVTLPFFSTGSFLQQFENVNWASIGLGVSICFLELGFLLAYRAGWNISIAALYVNVAVGLLLLPIGLLFFSERLSLANFAGIVLALVGLILIGKK